MDELFDDAFKTKADKLTQVPSEALWKRFESEVVAPKQKSVWRYWSVAASLLLLAVASFYFFTSSVDQLHATQMDFRVDQLELESPSNYDVELNQWINYQARHFN